MLDSGCFLGDLCLECGPFDFAQGDLCFFDSAESEVAPMDESCGWRDGGGFREREAMASDPGGSLAMVWAYRVDRQYGGLYPLDNDRLVSSRGRCSSEPAVPDGRCGGVRSRGRRGEAVEAEPYFPG